MTHVTCRLTAKNRDQLRTQPSAIEYGLPFLYRKTEESSTVCSYWGDHRSKCLPQLTSSLPLFVLLMGPDALCFWVVRLCVRVCLLGWRHSPTSLPSTCSFYSLIVQMLVVVCCAVECSCTEQHASLVYTTSLCSVVSRFCRTVWTNLSVIFWRCLQFCVGYLPNFSFRCQHVFLCSSCQNYRRTGSLRQKCGRSLWNSKGAIDNMSHLPTVNKGIGILELTVSILSTLHCIPIPYPNLDILQCRRNGLLLTECSETLLRS